MIVHSLIASYAAWAARQPAIFGQMANGTFPAYCILETQDPSGLFVIQDVRPRSLFHILAIPFEHEMSADTLSVDSYRNIGRLMPLLAEMMLDLNADGFLFRQNNYAPADQTVFHIHVHLLARYNQKVWQNRDMVWSVPVMDHEFMQHMLRAYHENLENRNLTEFNAISPCKRIQYRSLPLPRREAASRPAVPKPGHPAFPKSWPPHVTRSWLPGGANRNLVFPFLAADSPSADHVHNENLAD